MNNEKISTMFELINEKYAEIEAIVDEFNMKDQVILSNVAAVFDVDEEGSLDLEMVYSVSSNSADALVLLNRELVMEFIESSNNTTDNLDDLLNGTGISLN